MNRPMTIVHSDDRPRNAKKVEAITTGLSTGAASMNVIPADGMSPFWIKRRAIGTEPHSQIGNAIPASPAAGSCNGLGRFASFSSAPTGTKTSITAAASAPMSTNGSACTSNEPKITKKLWTHAKRSGSASPRRSRPQRSHRARPPTSARPLSGTVGERSYRPSAIPREGDGEALERVRHHPLPIGRCHPQERLHGGVAGDLLAREDRSIQEYAARDGLRDDRGVTLDEGLDLSHHASMR